MSLGACFTAALPILGGILLLWTPCRHGSSKGMEIEAKIKDVTGEVFYKIKRELDKNPVSECSGRCTGAESLRRLRSPSCFYPPFLSHLCRPGQRRV